jgi:hypothetical protein
MNYTRLQAAPRQLALPRILQSNIRRLLTMTPKVGLAVIGVLPRLALLCTFSFQRTQRLSDSPWQAAYTGPTKPP